MNPELSIIVPVYNVEKYLDKCISSILNQTFKDFELILVDDGSLDRSGLICDQYADGDFRIKVIHKQNGGLAAARNTGIKNSYGKYIGFVDSDDWIEPDMYELLYKSSIKYSADMSILGVREVDEDGKALNEYIPKELNLTEILKRAYAWNKLFKRELFIENNLYFAEGKYYEDIELIPKIFAISSKVTSVNKVGYNYLQRSNSITGSRDTKILDNLWAYTQIKQYFLKKNLYSLYKDDFEVGVEYFKSYYINILYDYPSTFLLKNYKKIYNDFSEIGGLKKKDYLLFLVKHLTFSLRRIGFFLKIMFKTILAKG